MSPSTLPPPRVTVEYDCRDQRRSKTFDCPYQARRFYVAKDRQGRHPKVRRADDAHTHQS